MCGSLFGAHPLRRADWTITRGGMMPARLYGKIRSVGVALTTTALCAALVAGAAAATSLEYTVKATYLYKFGGFVEWPQTVFSAPDSPTYLCLVGEDPFGAALDQAVEGQRIGEHPIVVKRLTDLDERSDCQIMYIGGSDQQKLSEALSLVRGENILTITDGASEPQSRGIINFVIADKRVRFEIDDQAASVNGVVISSKLLDLARSAKRRS
jgi:hypothetical protein